MRSFAVVIALLAAGACVPRSGPATEPGLPAPAATVCAVSFDYETAVLRVDWSPEDGCAPAVRRTYEGKVPPGPCLGWAVIVLPGDTVPRTFARCPDGRPRGGGG